MEERPPTHTSLMIACQQEARADVQAILDRQPGAALLRDRSGKCALHYCAENTNAECAALLLTAAPSLLDARDSEGYSPLHLAVISGNRTLLRFLMGHGADLAAVDGEKHTCVHWATVCGEVECLDMLVGAGADPSTPDVHGAYPVHYAAQMCGPNADLANDVRRGLAVLRRLLARGADVAAADSDGRQPLLWAASAGSSDAILALVNAGADVNSEDKDGLTALHCAASRGHLDCLETLITLCGAELDRPDSGGCSALFYAVTLGHADCTNLLLGFGADPNRQDLKGRTPAHCGAAKGQMETLKILAQHNANLWLRNCRGDMPLHEAVQSGRKDLVEWLLQQHPRSVNTSNSRGRTPLHVAAITNNVDLCKVLMDAGAAVNPLMRNSRGQQLTPLDAALHRSNRGCAKYLNLHGALPSSKLQDLPQEKIKLAETVSDALDLSPTSRRRVLRDSSAQTDAPASPVRPRRPTRTSPEEGRPRPALQQRPSPPRTAPRADAEPPTGKPIIAKVYVHTTRRVRPKRVMRKATGYRRDFAGEKVSTVVSTRAPPPQRHLANQRPLSEVSETTPRRGEASPPHRKASVLLEEAPGLKPPEVTVEEEEEEDVVVVDRGDLTTDDDTVSRTDQEEGEGRPGAESRWKMHRERILSAKDILEREPELDPETHSPLSSIRSLESTVKDSGFSDDLVRDDGPSSEDEEEDRVTRRRHIARYIVSSGAAEGFRLDEDDGGEEGANGGSSTPRSFSMPQLREEPERVVPACPRLLQRPAIARDVQRSLKKYQMERRLFYELQELKRKQICGIRENEAEVVRKSVARFRDHVLSPALSDFRGPFTYRAFERHLYEQLRKLSMGGKIPKLKQTEFTALPSRTYMSPIGLKKMRSTHALCTCESHKCHHMNARKDSYMSADPEERTGSGWDRLKPRLPEIIRTPQKKRSSGGHQQQQSRIPVSSRSRSWDKGGGQRRGGSALAEGAGGALGGPASRSLPALSGPFPRKIPAQLLAAICERLGSDVHPDDTVVVEMSAEGVASKMRHAFAVREIREAVARYEREAGRKVKPIPLEKDPDEDGPITFEIRHGKERSVFRLPAHKLKDNKKWQVTFTIGKWQKDARMVTK